MALSLRVSSFWHRLPVLFAVAVMTTGLQAGAPPRFEVITGFGRSAEHPARGGLVLHSDNLYWGTAKEGGDHACGAIYKVTGSSAVPVMHFSGTTGTAKGKHPIGALLSDGPLIWGVTQLGGTGNGGTVFKFNTASGTLTTVAEFGAYAPTDAGYMGIQPQAGLVKDGHGLLWGVNSSTDGYVFKVDAVSGTVVPVVQLKNGGAGVGAIGELAFDGVDSLWGVTGDILGAGLGIVYKVHQDTGQLTMVTQFTGPSPAGAAPGAYPAGSLVPDGQGFMLGLSVSYSGIGQVYKVEISTGKYSIARTVPALSSLGGVQGGLVSLGNGTFAGIGFLPSTSTATGVVFKLSVPGTSNPTALTFTDRVNQGANPVTLVPGPPGELAVVNAEGGLYDKGMVLRLGTSLQQFGSTSIGSGNDPELQTGSQPSGGLIQDSAGYLLGLVKSGGSKGMGLVYSFLPTDDKLKTLATFTILSGRNPVGELASLPTTPERAGYAIMHGLCATGGQPGVNKENGTKFSFTFSRGTNYGLMADPLQSSFVRYPVAGLAYAPDGTFWEASGSAVYFFANAYSPVSTKVATFTGTSGSTPGSQPVGRLFYDGQGSMWGATAAGGDGNNGTLYKVATTSKTFTSMVQFTGVDGTAQGGRPNGGLIADSAGWLWGTTAYGGHLNKGTVFKFDPVHPRLTSVVQFDDIPGSVPGRNPWAGLVADGRGYFWGTTSAGGASDCGTVFRINTATGSFESMVQLTGDAPLGKAPGSLPTSPLCIHADGNIYGTTTGPALDKNGAPKSGGNIFRLRLGQPLTVKASTSPLLLVDGVAYDYHSVFNGDASSKGTFTITNLNPTPVTGFTAVISGADAGDFKVTSAPGTTIAAGASVTAEVTFAPSALGLRQAVLTLGGASPDTDAFVIPLTGTGIQRTVSISQTSAITENGGPQPILITLAGPLSVPVKIPFKVTMGTASAADFSISASPVTIPAGSLTAAIWVTPKNDYLLEGSESFTVQLLTPSNPNVALVQGAESLSSMVVDDDELPTFSLIGGGAAALGTVYGIDSGFSNPSGMPCTIWWTRNGRVIPGATQPNYWIASVTAASAGTYRCFAKTITGVTLSSNPIDLSVQAPDNNTHTLTVAGGSAVSMPSLLTGDDLNFSWTIKTGDDSETTVNNDARFSGAESATLHIANASPSDAGHYLCYVNGSFTGISFRLFVETTAPVLSGLTFPVATAAREYVYSLPYVGGDIAAPISSVAKGLPPGLVCDVSSGVISGRPSAVGHFKVTVTMTNTHGHASASAYLDVTALPAALTGSYVGLVEPGYYSSIGSRIDVRVAANGSLSGTLTVGTLRRPFTGSLSLNDDGTAALEKWLPGSNSSAVPGVGLALTFDENNSLAGRLTCGVDNPAVNGWRNVWNATSKPASGVASYHALGLLSITGGYGSGYGSLTVGVNGSAVLSGRLADNSVFATSSMLSQEFWFLAYQSLYPEQGGLFGTAGITPASPPGGLDTIDQFAGFAWSTPPKKAKTRYFQNGVDGTTGWFVNVQGCSYKKPKSGEILLGLPVVPAGVNNAQFVFAIDQNVISSPPNVAFRLDASARATLPVPGSSYNPGRVANVSFNAATGFFSGTFLLDYRTPLARTSTFQGMLVPAQSQGFGFFIIPTPAQPYALPPTTLLTSPMASGEVRMLAYPTPAP